MTIVGSETYRIPFTGRSTTATTTVLAAASTYPTGGRPIVTMLSISWHSAAADGLLTIESHDGSSGTTIATFEYAADDAQVITIPVTWRPGRTNGNIRMVTSQAVTVSVNGDGYGDVPRP